MNSMTNSEVIVFNSYLEDSELFEINYLPRWSLAYTIDSDGSRDFEDDAPAGLIVESNLFQHCL